MNVLAKPRMTVDQFLAWAEEHPGRYELFRGEVIGMAPETAEHAEIKAAVHAALLAGVQRHRLPCHVLPDGMTVRVDELTAYEPDALVYCGQKVAGSTIEIPNPVILVEVLSPSTQRVDVAHKLVGYFRLPSVMHYLIVNPAKPSVIHHARGEGEIILTRIVTEGSIALDPPGLTIALGDIYAA